MARPSRLLNLQKSPASNKQIAATNATTSPLLILSAEIRIRIWTYVLGGHTLHVASNGRVGAITCRNGSNYDDDRTLHPNSRSETPPEEHNSSHPGCIVLASHEQCYQSPSHLDLDLLQTCRQVYHEAVLIHFQKNAFAVAHYAYSGDDKSFLDSLVPAQVRAIGHLIVQTTELDICNRRLLARTKGVVTLQYVLLNWTYQLRVLPSWWLDYRSGEGRLAKFYLESLIELPQLRNVSIEPRIILHPELSAAHVMEGFLALGAVRELAEGAERKMLKRES